MIGKDLTVSWALGNLAAAARTTEARAEPASPKTADDPRAGIRCGAYLRPEPLFSLRSLMVVHAARSGNNPGGVIEVPSGKHRMIETDQLLSDDKQVLIGFGMPKVTTLLPRGGGQSGYDKLETAPYFSHPSRVMSGDWIESGIFIRPRNLPADAVDGLRTAMRQMAGHRSASSARATAHLLSRAGFTSGGRSLSQKLFPMRLFVRIAEHGLEYKGQRVDFDIISTTPATLDEHFRAVVKHEILSPWNMLQEPANEPAPQPPPMPAPSPSASHDDGGVRVHIRNSRPGWVASMLREHFGAHVLWEAVPDRARVDVDNYLPETLPDKFHSDKPLSLKDKLKGMVFNPVTEEFLRNGVAHTLDDAGDFSPEQIAQMLRVPGDGEEIKPDKHGRIVYNLVICGNKSRRGQRMAIARLDVKHKKADDVLSKHVFISGYDNDVRFAGEVWAERFTKADGTTDIRIHVNNNSGTYQPTAEQAIAAGKYFSEVFKGIEVVVHPMNARDIASPLGRPDYIKSYAVSGDQLSALRSLAGRTFTLKDAQGKGQNFKIRPFWTVEMDMSFYDTAGRGLLKTGGMLRSRTRFKSPGSDRVKEIELEAKIPTPEQADNEFQNRIKGAEFKSAAAWQDAQKGLLAPDSKDPAVGAARAVVGQDVPLQAAASKNTRREMFLVTPTTWIIGRFKPSFIISMDTNTARDPQAARPRSTNDPPGAWHVFQPGIFTKLPWTRHVYPQRVERFHDLCSQIAAEFNLSPTKQSAYAETVEHLPK